MRLARLSLSRPDLLRVLEAHDLPLVGGRALDSEDGDAERPHRRRVLLRFVFALHAISRYSFEIAARTPDSRGR